MGNVASSFGNRFADGCWYGRPDGMSGQDVPIAVKGREQESFSQPKERI